MIKLPFVLLACIIGVNLSAQISITGHVTDSLNNPVPFASVYLSNTTIGTSADNLGAYKLKIPQDGQYELTINCIGYKTYSKLIHIEGKNIVINAILRSSAQTLNEITVTAKDGNRKLNYSRFIKVFLGESNNSRSCNILNPEDLRLHYDKENKKLTGYSVKPLIIENRALGYKIIYDLKNFEHYSNKGISRYNGSPFFHLMNGSGTEQELWDRARLITYYGSQMHFMRTLYKNNLKLEKYELYEENIDKTTIENINDKPLIVNDLQSAKGPDYIVVYSLNPVVIYYENQELESELSKSQSYIYKSILTFKNSLKVFENGYFEDGYNISWEGKMSKERMADMLPFDFQPDLWGLSTIQIKPKEDSCQTDNVINRVFLFEKVYLHIDRTRYQGGENIWFKAYLTDVVTQKLSENSNNLHVELISPDSRIIDQKIIRLETGLGNGDFHLKDSVPPGDYQIRAYTHYMRNFGDKFFFRKIIQIENQTGIIDAKENSKENSGTPDIQFFPEGGSLIEDVPAIMGVKAVDLNGFGCNIKGKIISSKGDTVASFTSADFGMGNFFFTPAKQLTYIAEGVSDNVVPFKVPILSAIVKGYALAVSDCSNNFFRVTINTNQETLEENTLKELLIQATSHNSLCLTAQAIMDSTSISVLLPKKDFPDGIACITLKDNTGIIYSERLFYVHKKSPIKVSVFTDKSNYSPREKVNLKISVRDTSNNPVTSSVSVAVVDGQQVMGYETKPDIASYLLLQSEIRGNIEQPYSYFDTTNRNRLKAMDNLLLTQGWRNYIWKQLADTNINMNYSAENGLTISGRLKNSLGNNPLTNVNISMAIFDSENPIYRFTNTDSTGKYSFEAINFTGEKTMVVSASNKRDIPKGIISVDSMYYSYPALTSFHNQASKYSKFEETKDEEFSQKKYRVTDTIRLKEVLVKAVKPKIENKDTYFRIYGEPDKSITVTPEISSDYRSILDYLTGRVTMPPAMSYLEEHQPSPLYLVSGIPVNKKTLSAIPLSMVDKIEILKSPTKLAIYGARGAYGVIVIWLKDGSASKSYIAPVLSSLNCTISGYYQTRAFYSPQYDIPSSENSKPDFRSTIFWEPNLITDSEGNASCYFFNADNISTIRVAVEGITENGNPLVGKTVFVVK